MKKQGILRILGVMIVFMLSLFSVSALQNDSNLVAHWKLEDLTDSSGNGNTLTLNGNTALVGSCHDGSCYTFDGVGDYLDTGSQLFDTVSGTVNIWFNTDDITDRFLISDRSTTSNYFQLLLESTGKVNSIINSGTSYTAQDTSSITANTWYMATLTWGSGGMKLYVDGTQVGSNAYTGTWSANSNMLIGRGSAYPSFDWDGELDDVSIWNRELSSTEITDLHTNGIEYNISGGGGGGSSSSDPVFDGIKAYYKADSNSTFPDEVNSLDGTINGSTYNSSGKINGAYQFDGTNDNIQLPFDSGAMGGSFSISTWFYPTRTDSGNAIISADNLASRGFTIQYGSGNVLNYYIKTAGGFWNRIGSQTFPANSWYHLVVTYDGTSLKVYKNGVEDTGLTGDTSSGDLVDNNINVELGHNSYDTGSNRYFQGLIDEVGIWNATILNSTEVTNLYNSGSGLPYSTSTPTEGITLISPTNSSTVQSINDVTFTFSSYFSNVSLTSCSLYGDFNGTWGLNQTLTQNFTNSVNYNFTALDLSAGSYNWNVQCTDNTTSTHWGASNYTLTVQDLNLQDTTYSFNTSDGVQIYYDRYYNGSTKSPLVIMSDAFSSGSTRADNRGQAQWVANQGYFVLNLDTRGKGDSGGSHDINGYECLDLYEAVNDALTGEYASYINESSLHIWGNSGAGGRTMTCIGKYPDFWQSANEMFGIANYTHWYDNYPERQTDLQNWIGGTTTTNAEGYRSRSALEFPENIFTPLIIFHNPADGSVPVLYGRQMNASLSALNRTVDYNEVPITHTFDPEVVYKSEAVSFFNTYSSPITLPTDYTMSVFGYLVTKNFSVEFNDVGKIGTLDYNLISKNEHRYNLTTETYTGQVNFSAMNLNENTTYVLKYSNGTFIEYLNTTTDGTATWSMSSVPSGELTLVQNSNTTITSYNTSGTLSSPANYGGNVSFNVYGSGENSMQLKICSNIGATWGNCTLVAQNLDGTAWTGSDNVITATTTVNTTNYNNTVYGILYDNQEYQNFTLNYYVNQIPNTSNFNMQDILGGQTYFYGETIDYFRINVNDTEDNISGLNAQITVTKANGTIAVNSVNMTDLTSITKEYSPNVYLDVRGVWNVSIVVTDSNSGSTTYNTNFTVQNNLPEISNATIDLISLNGRNQTWNFQFDYSDFENDNLTTCGLYIDNTNISQNGSGSSCNFNVSYALNESIFNTQIFVIDSEGGISTNGGNYTLASLVYDRIESSEQVGNLTIQYFNKYYNITNPNANYSNISFSYESDLSREINLTTGTSSQWTYFDTNLIEYGSYDYIRDVLNTYTVNAGESVFRYFNVTGNLSTGENVPGFNISLQTQNYIAGTQNMNFSATNTSNYADYTNFTSDQTMNAYIQPLNNGVTDFYYYDYKAKIVYSNSIINSTHADNVRTYYFQNEDSNNYGRKVQFMFDNLRNASVKVYDIIAFSTLTGWTSKLDSTQVVYRYDGSSYNQLTSGVDYTYTVNTGSEQVEFYFNPLITPLTNNFIDLSWSVYEEGGTITPTPAPSGGGGGGGGSSTPSTDLSTGKQICDVFVTPKTIYLDDSELLQELRISNQETFGFDPEFRFQYVSGDSDLVDKLRITNTLTLVDSGKEALTGVRLSTFFLSSGTAKGNLVISSTKCVDIKVPIEISIEQSSGVAEIINEVAGENKTLSEVVVDLSDKSFFGKVDTNSGTIPIEKSFFEKAIDKTFSVLGLTIVIGLLMLIVVIPTGNNPKRYSENNFLDITARFVIWAVVTGIGGIVILVFHIMFFS